MFVNSKSANEVQGCYMHRWVFKVKPTTESEYLKLACQEDLQVFLIASLRWQLHIPPNRGKKDETAILVMLVYDWKQGMIMYDIMSLRACLLELGVCLPTAGSKCKAPTWSRRDWKRHIFRWKVHCAWVQEPSIQECLHMSYCSQWLPPLLARAQNHISSPSNVCPQGSLHSSSHSVLFSSDACTSAP